MSTKTVAAYELQAGMIVHPTSGPPRRVALARCQGAPPEVIVQWAGTDTRTTYPAIQAITVEEETR